MDQNKGDTNVVQEKIRKDLQRNRTKNFNVRISEYEEKQVRDIMEMLGAKTKREFFSKVIKKYYAKVLDTQREIPLQDQIDLESLQLIERIGYRTENVHEKSAFIEQEVRGMKALLFRINGQFETLFENQKILHISQQNFTEFVKSIEAKMLLAIKRSFELSVMNSFTDKEQYQKFVKRLHEEVLENYELDIQDLYQKLTGGKH